MSYLSFILKFIMEKFIKEFYLYSGASLFAFILNLSLSIGYMKGVWCCYDKVRT